MTGWREEAGQAADNRLCTCSERSKCHLVRPSSLRKSVYCAFIVCIVTGETGGVRIDWAMTVLCLDCIMQTVAKQDLDCIVQTG